MLIRQKILLGAALAFPGFVLAVGVSIYEVKRVEEEMQQDTLAVRVTRDVFHLSLLTRDYLRAPSPRIRAQWTIKRRELSDHLRALELHVNSAHERVHLRRLFESERMMGAIFDRLVRRDEMLDFSNEKRVDLARYRLLLDSSFALRSEIMIADAAELSSLSRQEVKQVRTVAFVGAVSALAFFGALIIGLAFYWARKMLRTAGDLRNGAAAFGRGELDHVIRVRGNDELAMVSSSFNEMAQRLKNTQHNLHSANEGLHEEVRVRAAAEAKLQASEEQFRSLAQSANDAIISCDRFGTITFCNPAAKTIFGYSENMAGMSIQALMPERFRAAHQQGFDAYAETGASRVIGKTVELIGLRGDGSEFPMDLSLAAWVTSEGQFFTSVIRDISARKQAEERLFREKELAQVTLSSIADAVITTDAVGRIQFLNPMAAQLSGWEEQEALESPFSEIFKLVSASAREPLGDVIDNALRTQRSFAMSDDLVLISRDGEESLIQLSAAPIVAREGTINGVVIVCHNVTETRALTARLVHQASHDALTGLHNRAYFEEAISAALHRARNGGQESTLLYLDLDQFKVINDSCSHMAGDELLRQIAKLVAGISRRADTVARLGGDEFGVLLNDCALEDANRIAFGLTSALSDFRFNWHDKLFSVTASIGLVSIDTVSVDQASILSAADTACFLAKDRGRNQIAVFEPENAEIVKRHGEMNWVSRITQGLQEHRFVLFHQRIVSIDGKHDGGEHFELLLRLRGDDGRMVPPMAFIPAAERYNLMPAVDRWVIATFFDYAARRHRRHRDDTFAINISGTSINDPSFLSFVMLQFERTEASPRSICFEITETAAIANLTRATEFMTALKQLGCRFSLDDFGSGLSSFGYLKNLPVDYLKIDGSFVKGIVNDRIDRAMVDAINRVGHIIGIKTIAEFVDNEKMLEELSHIGVDFAQGYGVHQPEPLPPIEAEPAIAGVDDGDNGRDLVAAFETELPPRFK